ncbi:hypothetical protein RB195_003300 [Necator americanus]|uniref:SSD domain-containing protein n=1 Tax=Necator americanus TaxID=51031 RepID=A0ABR1DNQ0_NECAM
MTRLSLADEEIYAHASIRLSVPGIVIFVTSILLTALALSNVRKEIEPWEGNNDTMTRYLIENVENREQIPDNEWMPSLFRSTQLFIIVQTSTTFAMIRGIFGVTTILIVSDILNNVTSFTYAMNCDQMVAPYDAMCEYIFLVMMFASYAMDILEMPSIQLCVTCSEEDAMDYNRLKMERKAAQLKKHNL